jgi:hypothetical protein
MTRTMFLAILAPLSLAGCVGQDDVDASGSALTVLEAEHDALESTIVVIPEWQWRPARACDERLPVGTVRPVAGERGLAAIVGETGVVLCVDVTSRLRAEAVHRVPTSGTHTEEPTPEPM